MKKAREMGDSEDEIDDSSDDSEDGSEIGEILADDSDNIDSSEISEERPSRCEMEEFNIQQLRDLAAREGLKTYGSRGVLFTRVVDAFERDWPVDELRVVVPKFHGSVGFRKCDVTGTLSPGELFCLLFTDELCDMIVAETNRYALHRRLAEVINHLSGTKTVKGQESPRSFFAATNHWPNKQMGRATRVCRCGCGRWSKYICEGCQLPLIPEHFKAFHLSLKK